MKTTAIYVRRSVSDADKGNNSLSIAAQKEECIRFLGEGADFRIYCDDGISGTTFDRDGFKQMMSDVQSGEVKTVIVKDMSRFGRDYIQVGLYTEILFPQNNVRFIAINDSYDSKNGDNDFIPFKNIMNEWYAKDTSKKIKAVNKAKARAGEHLTSNVPYGYIKNPDNPKQWIIDEKAAEVVREIFQLCLQGLNMYQIATELYARNILKSTQEKYGKTFWHMLCTALYYERVNDIEKAKEYAERARAILPDDANLNNLIARDFLCRF